MTPTTNLPSLAEIHDLDRSTQTITLKDQRELSFNVFGADGGKPVFYFHGGPSSRLEGSLHHQTAIQRNYQIICQRKHSGYPNSRLHAMESSST